MPDIPNPDDVFTGEGYGAYQELMQNIMPLYNGDPRYFGYWNAVFIDPNYDLSGLTPEEKLSLPDEAYIKNGEDPNRTMYLIPYGMEVMNCGQEPSLGPMMLPHLKLRK